MLYPCWTSPVWDCMLHPSRPWPVCGTASGKEMGEPRKPSGTLPGSRRPPTEGHISCKERPQRNRQGAGDACPHYRRSGGERREMGEGHAVDDSGRNCLIFRTEILGMEGEVVLFSPLQAYTKNAPTILAAYNKPCELHQGGPDLREVLPPIWNVEFVWRTRKPQLIGVAIPSCELVEVPEMAAARRLSTEWVALLRVPWLPQGACKARKQLVLRLEQLL